MKYYRILDNIYFKNRWQLYDIEGARSTVDSSLDFTVGHFFYNNEAVFCKKEEGKALDFTLAEFDVPIISSKVVKILSKFFDDDVQLIPASIEGEKEEYFILNVIKLYDCLDEKKSLFTKWTEKDHRPDLEGDYRMVGNLRIDKSKVNNSNILRIKKWDIPLIVSELMKNEIEKNNIKGVIFEKV